VRYAMFLPNFGPFGDPALIGDLAARAEAAGWDGFFIWDHILFSATETYPVVDPWIALAAAAVATNRIRIGALMTPLSRRRPWQVARQTVSLDHLSGGRLVFGAGLGYPPDADFALFGEQHADRARARRLDEGLDLLDRLWTGEQVTFSGEEYRVGPVTFRPAPVQKPRIPVWVAGWWPNRPPFRRAARWDGVVPELVGGGLPSVAQINELAAYVRDRREPGRPFDVVVNGHDCWDRQEVMPGYASAGLTWWLERIDPDRAFSVAEATALIDRKPPGP
jgi:alkanesulfonate monooxygenase SsuD/methylene tetrahydromethanopterin reductase-like flavin-dependent oxidoreductase (luciferase family)